MGNKKEGQPVIPEEVVLSEEGVQDVLPTPTGEKIKGIMGGVQDRIGVEQAKSAELPDESKFYQSEDGMVIALSREDNKVYISRSEGPFIEQVVTPFCRSKLRVRDPNEKSGIILTVLDDQISIRDKEFKSIPTPTEFHSVISIPEKIQVEYNFKLSDGTPFVITSDRNAGDYYASFKIMIGDQTLQTLSSERFRDGGTTIISTDRGKFRIGPSGESPTWNGESLLNVD